MAGRVLKKSENPRKNILSIKDLNNKFVSTLINTLPGIFYIIDKKGHFLIWNNKLEKITGYSAVQLKSMTPFHLVVPEDKNRLQKNMRKVFSLGEASIELTFKAKNGAKIPCLLSGSSVRLNGGQYIIRMGVDIHDRKMAEENLAFEHKQLLSIFDSITEPIYITNPKTYEVMFVNKTLKKLLKKNPVNGLCYKEFQNLKAPCPFCTNKILLKMKGKPYQWEFYNKNLKRHFLITDRLIRWPDGCDVRFELAVDITKLKEIIDELAQSENRFKNIFEGAQDGIVVLDVKNKKFVLANKSFCKMTGYEESEINKIGVTNIHPKSILPGLLKQIDYLAGRKDVFFKNLPTVKKDGILFYADVSGTWIDLAGKRYVVGIFRNVTESKKIEDMKDSLIRDITHEFKTPLAMTEMALEMCSRGFKEGNFEKIQKAHRIASSNLARFKKDLDNIMSIFSMGASIPYVREKLHIKSILDNIINNQELMIKEKYLKVIVDISLEADTLWADEKDIYTLFTNLIDNAIKFTDKGQITIKTRKIKDDVLIEVCDTGRGIARQHLQSIYDKFFKIHPNMPGTGLGLTICKDIVERYKGSISVKSSGPGMGTCFTIKFPAKMKKQEVK